MNCIRSFTFKLITFSLLIITIGGNNLTAQYLNNIEKNIENIDSLKIEINKSTRRDLAYLDKLLCLQKNILRLGIIDSIDFLSEIDKLSREINSPYYNALVIFLKQKNKSIYQKNLSVDDYYDLRNSIQILKKYKDTLNLVEGYFLQAELLLKICKSNSHYLDMFFSSNLAIHSNSNILSMSFANLDSAKQLTHHFNDLKNYLIFQTRYQEYLITLDFNKYRNKVANIALGVIDTVKSNPQFQYFLPITYRFLATSFRYSDSSQFFKFLNKAEKEIKYKPSILSMKILSDKGFAYADYGLSKRGAFYLTECLNQLNKFDTLFPQAINACLYHLPHLYYENGEYKKASEFAMQFILSNQTLQKEKSFYDFYNLSFKEKLDAKDDKLKKQQEKLEQKTRMNWALTAISILLAALLIAVIYFLKKIRESKNKLSTQIKENKKLQKAKDDIYAMLAHDIKSPMKENLMRIHLLEEIKENNTALFEEINEIEKNSFNLLVLIDNILSWSTQNPVELSSKIETIALDIFFDNYVFPYIRIYEKSKRQLKIYWQKNLYLQGNPAHLSIIIRNLLDNSIKYSIENTVIEISLSQTTQQKIIFSVVNLTSENEKRLKSYIDYLVHTLPEPTIKNQFGLGSTLIKKYTNLYRYPISAELTRNKALSISIEFT